MRKAVAAGLVIGLLALAGASYVVLFPHGFALPEVERMWHEWGIINENVTEVVSHVVLHNPSRIPATVEDVSYTIYLNGIELAEGRLERPVDLPPEGDAELVLRTSIDNTRIPALWLSHLQNNEETKVELKGAARVKAFGVPLTVPIYYAREVGTELDEWLDYENETKIYLTPSVYVVVRGVDTSLGSFNETTTQFVHVATVYNPNKVAVAVGKMWYEVFVNGIRLAVGEQPEALIIGPGGEVEVTFYTYLDNGKLDDVWVSHLLNGENATILVRVYMVVDHELVPIYEYMDQVETDLLGYLTGPP